MTRGPSFGRWLAPVALLLACGALGRAGEPTNDNARPARPAATPEQTAKQLGQQIDAALESAAAFLVAQQSADGAWRSEVYAPFRDGDALSPLVLQGLLSLRQTAPLKASCALGAVYLAAPVQSDGAIRAGPRGLNYPVYTAAGAVVVLSDAANSERRPARDAWLKYLRERQLTEALGWQPSDEQYGGWGYSAERPRKPKAGEAAVPMSDPNLSATVFALEALRRAGAKSDDPALKRAQAFVERCQNFAADSRAADPKFDDGGFFFMLGDAVRNKAGVAGPDAAGRQRFHSYGSTTADGLRALLLCGAGFDSPRVLAAKHWLDDHFQSDNQPGDYAPDREHARPSLYYYYARSQALAWIALIAQPESGLEIAPARQIPAAERSAISRRAIALAAELIKRQCADGSWRNPSVDVREDDPLVASPLALEALSACRALIAERHDP